MWAKSGPGTKRNSRRPATSSMTLVPVMSLGIRSGVNWMRRKVRDVISAMQETIIVLARPGTPTIRQWPRAKMQATICRSTCSCP